MRGNYDGKTADEVRADLRRVIKAAKEVRDSSFDFNDKYDELLRYGVYYAKDTFKEDRDERRKSASSLICMMCVGLQKFSARRCITRMTVQISFRGLVISISKMQ